MAEKNVVQLDIDNCLDCRDHKLVPDPDPSDWFCDDDEAVLCTLTPNPDRDLTSNWAADRSEFRAITCSCRPTRTRVESTVPDWCPKLKTK